MAEAEAWVLIPKLDKDRTGCVLDMHPLVLCKDCIYWEKYDDVSNIGNCKLLNRNKRRCWFCADGESRD